MGKFTLLLALAGASGSDAITELSKHFVGPAPCAAPAGVLRALPDELEFEVSFALIEKRGRCEYEFYATGKADSVRVPTDRVDQTLADPHVDAYDKVHSHPLANVAYFAAGHPYAFEIMFADEAMIRTRQLPENVYARLVLEVKRGRVPGFSLSPPSLQDFMAASTLSAVGPKRVRSQVISSGGVWTYAVDGDAKKAQKDLMQLVDYALQYEIASSERFPERRRGFARAYFEEALQTEWGPIIRAWRETGFELRAPYSEAAVRAYLENGDARAIHAEYARKLESARHFSAVCASLGLTVTFEPFAPDSMI